MMFVIRVCVIRVCVSQYQQGCEYAVKYAEEAQSTDAEASLMDKRPGAGKR